MNPKPKATVRILLNVRNVRSIRSALNIRSVLNIRNVVTLGFIWSSALFPQTADEIADWPQEQVDFFFEGGALLVDRDQRDELRELDNLTRGSWIEEFLADPVPETPENELRIGISRRRTLALTEFLTMLDHRARLLFLQGTPDQRKIIECGATLNPLEIWHYGERQLIVYQPQPGRPYRLWHPIDSKRSLYSEGMAYILQQLGEYGIRRRIDVRACKDVTFVDEATGILGLRKFTDKMPDNGEIAALLKPPTDLKEWARQAAATPLEILPPTLTVEKIQLSFPEEVRQRILTRVMVTLPSSVEVEPYVDEVSGKSEYRFVVVGMLEQDGQIFEEFRIRFKLPPPTGDTAMALTFDRRLRPDRDFILRFRLEDEIGPGRAYASRGFKVPKEPEPQLAEVPLPEDAVVAFGEELALSRMAGQDSMLIVPPDGDLVLGLWRVDVLVTGERIQKVVFLVDGEEQLSRASQPFSAEVRLAKYPREQVIRVEGYDQAGELVTSDEVAINQPRGSFAVRIVEPAADATVVGSAMASAEIVIPDEATLATVEFRLNDELIQELKKAPWKVPIEVADTSQTTYLAVTAILEDGSRVEDVRFLNSPEYLEQVEVDFVELLTTVLDNDRRPVSGLAQTDFSVFEDGRPQDLARFELVENLPLAVGVTVDTSGSMAMLLPEAQRAASDFLRRVITPRDRAFAVGFAREPILLIPPTDDIGAVEAALGNLRSMGSTALHDAVVSSLYYFRGMKGRKALVLLSDGNDSASHYPFRDAVEYARRSGVVIYTIGLDVGKFETEIRGKLKTLARETGGRSFFIDRANELDTVYTEIERELRSQYLLAYNSDADVATGDDFRTIEVKVTGGRKARTIAGYYP